MNCKAIPQKEHEKSPENSRKRRDVLATVAAAINGGKLTWLMGINHERI
jgi:hypothetical protein